MEDSSPRCSREVGRGLGSGLFVRICSASVYFVSAGPAGEGREALPILIILELAMRSWHS
jgi:hypothetical protein